MTIAALSSASSAHRISTNTNNRDGTVMRFKTHWPVASTVAQLLLLGTPWVQRHICLLKPPCWRKCERRTSRVALDSHYISRKVCKRPRQPPACCRLLVRILNALLTEIAMQRLTNIPRDTPITPLCNTLPKHGESSLTKLCGAGVSGLSAWC